MISAVQPDVIRKLLKELQLIEPAVAEHGKRVQLISLCLALHIEHLSADDLYTLSIAAVFHDIENCSSKSSHTAFITKKPGGKYEDILP